MSETTLSTCENESCENKDKCKRYKAGTAVINFEVLCNEENNHKWFVKK